MNKNKYKMISMGLLLFVGLVLLVFAKNDGVKIGKNMVTHAQTNSSICPTFGFNKIVDKSGMAAYSQTLGYIKASHHIPASYAKINSTGAFSGFVYSQTAGWISMQGVTVDCQTGKLSGNAYGQIIGWINFSPSQAYIDINSNDFQGNAYSQTAGWINLLGWQVGTPSVSLSASPPEVNFGGTTTLSWTSQDVTNCKFTQGTLANYSLNQSVPLNDSTPSSPLYGNAGPVLFTIQCCNDSNSCATSTVSVGVITNPPQCGINGNNQQSNPKSFNCQENFDSNGCCDGSGNTISGSSGSQCFSYNPGPGETRSWTCTRDGISISCYAKRENCGASNWIEN